MGFEIANLIITIILGSVTVVFAFYGLYNVVKLVIVKKDERMKMIVTKSMAHAFVLLFILYAIQLALKFILGASYEIWWANIKHGFYIEPVMLCIILFGMALFINKRRFG